MAKSSFFSTSGLSTPENSQVGLRFLSEILATGNQSNSRSIEMTGGGDIAFGASSEINFETGKFKLFHDGDGNLSATTGDIKYTTSESGKGHKWYTQGVGGTGTSMSLSTTGTLSVDANVNAAGLSAQQIQLNNSNGNHTISNFNTSTTLSSSSDSNVPTTAAIKAYVDASVTTGVNLGSGVTITSGANTPEGAVTAPVGSLFLRTNGGSNTTLYVKESGTGNTGWSAK
tara:strand:- start:1292 stop:1978 length:687 start_codon:yes stop_codon:yes gene_type:complete